MKTEQGTPPEDAQAGENKGKGTLQVQFGINGGHVFSLGKIPSIIGSFTSSLSSIVVFSRATVKRASPPSPRWLSRWP